jgi:hypothetical protein
VAPVGVHDHALSEGALQLNLQTRRAGRQHADDFVKIAVGGGLRQPEPSAQPRDIALVPKPGQGEQRLPVAAQPAGSFPGADLAAVRRQQPGDEQDQLHGNVEHDTIGDHAEPLPVAGDLWRDFHRGLRVSPATQLMSACLPGRPLRHVAHLILAGKTTLKEGDRAGVVGPHEWSRLAREEVRPAQPAGARTEGVR